LQNSIFLKVTFFAAFLSQKTLHKNGAGGVAQGKGPELKPQYCKKKVAQQEPASKKEERYSYNLFGGP
jgi:hypothetical protein